MILTGGPGTGKTTTLNAVISIYEKMGKRVLITAPTGRAAQRISELTGHDARTIHRMLEVGFNDKGDMHFIHNERNPLNCDVMVVDEMSMIDVLLFESLLRALRVTCSIVMVGDSDQLPSVRAGNVLGDLIDSGKLPVVRLKEIFRQSEKSCIVTNAHKIIKGEYPDLAQKNSDFFFFQRMNAESAYELIASLYSERLPKAYDYSILDDIQILCPSRKGILGTVELNKRIQDSVNPKKTSVKEIRSLIYTFREGDKVMQIKNNYDIAWHKDDGEEGTGIYNGDIGVILKVNPKSHDITIKFDSRETVYSSEQLEQLELAYAVTIHKSQGSEFPAVIIPVLEGFDKLYYRNLLYTGVTRARKLLILVGSQFEIYRMVDNNRRTLRYTCLKDMLENEIEI
jgi:exodeoxyribonuclease V alpha subunit